MLLSSCELELRVAGCVAGGGDCGDSSQRGGHGSQHNMPLTMPAIGAVPKKAVGSCVPTGF